MKLLICVEVFTVAGSVLGALGASRIRDLPDPELSGMNGMDPKCMQAVRVCLTLETAWGAGHSESGSRSGQTAGAPCTPAKLQVSGACGPISVQVAVSFAGSLSDIF